MTFCRCRNAFLSRSASPSWRSSHARVERSHPSHSHVYRALPDPMWSIERCSIKSDDVGNDSPHDRHRHTCTAAAGGGLERDAEGGESGTVATIELAPVVAEPLAKGAHA